MKCDNKFFKIELAENEIELITTALHGEYKFIKDKYSKAGVDDALRLYEKMNNIKLVRNEFAKLINRFYSGEDA